MSKYSNLTFNNYSFVVIFEVPVFPVKSHLTETDGITFVLLGKARTVRGSCIRMVSS